MAARKGSAKVTSEENLDFYRKAEAAYAEAMQTYLGKRDWAKAARAFEAFIEQFASRLDVSEFVDRARLHLEACQVRLADAPKDPQDGEGWLLRGIWLANSGRLDDALVAFDRALGAGAPAARVHYARAAGLAIGERLEDALTSLRAAIDADPINRAYSLGDPDFERLRETAGYAAMVDPPEARDEREETESDDDALDTNEGPGF